MDTEAGLTRTEKKPKTAEPEWHHRLLHPTTARHTSFAIVYGTFTKTHQAWVLNQTFTNLTDTREKKFFDYDRIKVDINHRKITGKSPALFYILNNQCLQRKRLEGNLKISELNKNENTPYHSLCNVDKGLLR